jgi:ADP-ribosylation factor-like protein 2
MLKSLLGEDLMDVSPTLGFDIRSLAWALPDEEGELSLNVWDVGGQETIRAYWCVCRRRPACMRARAAPACCPAAHPPPRGRRNYFEETDGLVWVVDSADVERLQVCAKTLREVLHEERLLGASLLILANKQDLAGAKCVSEIEAIVRPGELGSRHWSVVPCSAVTGQGLRQGMDWLCRDIAQRVFVQD